MATHVGSEGVVQVGANDIAEVKSWSITEEITLVDDSAMADAWESHLNGRKRWNAEVTCNWDETDTNGQAALTNGASVTLNLKPEGDSNGDTYFTGTATVESITVTTGTDQTIDTTIRLRGNGILTITTVSA